MLGAGAQGRAPPARAMSAAARRPTSPSQAVFITLRKHAGSGGTSGRAPPARTCPPRRGGPTSPSQAIYFHELLRKHAGSGGTSGRAPPARAIVRRGAADPPRPVKLSIFMNFSENMLGAGAQVGARRRRAQMSAAARRTHLGLLSSPFSYEGGQHLGFTPCSRGRNGGRGRRPRRAGRCSGRRCRRSRRHWA